VENEKDEVIRQVTCGETLPKVIQLMDFDKYHPIIVLPAISAFASISSTNDSFIIDKALFEGVLSNNILLIIIDLSQIEADPM
jgi:hypothetical protein